ncbi:F-box protein CPR1 [Camellia lanceoleosa]|uniref:F-box protein CPR1 n=1 Tax=Camellia lanceoleosa TaxID=1840588 RepID=A0ACC0HEK0_9ERIC|nr:F-box protein CPR1 [Camellia lanceoleosa]
MPCKPQGPYMFVLGFGAHPMTHEYKVVRIVYEKEHINQFKVPPKVELYTQRIGSWREIDSAAAPPYYIVEFMWSQAFMNGAVHWVAYDPSVVGGFRNLIVSFDMVSEAFSEMMLPPALAGQRSTCLSIKLFGESLAVFCGAEMGRSSCCIWVMKEYGVAESWTKLFSIILPGVLNKTMGFRRMVRFAIN